MMRYLRWTGYFLLPVLLVLLLVFFTASSWLETPAGRTLLQREMGKGLGVTAELNGDYALEMFPGLQIAGEQLELRDTASGERLASLAAYQLHLALWPLLKKQVVIHKIAASDGFFDLDLVTAQAESTEGKSGVPGEIPSIQSLELAGLRIRSAGVELLTIDHLQLEDFATGQDSAFRLGFSMPNDPAVNSLVEAQGSLRLGTAPLHLTLGLEGLSVLIREQPWPIGSGTLDWSSETGNIRGTIRGEWVGFSSQLEIAVATRPKVTANLSAQLLSPDQRVIAARISTRDAEDMWLLQPVELALDGQFVEGRGCLYMEPRAQLQMELRSAELDLDQLQSLVPARLLVKDGDSESAANELPLDVAVELRIDKAKVAGAEAFDVRMLLGQKPFCTAWSEAGTP